MQNLSSHLLSRGKHYLSTQGGGHLMPTYYKEERPRTIQKMLKPKVFIHQTTRQSLGKRHLGLCAIENLGPTGSECKIRKIKRNGSNIRC